MKFRVIILTASIILAGWTSSSAQTLESILKDVETGNMTLAAARESMTAAGYDDAATNTLSPTSIEYSPFFRSGASGVASSELIVSQEFDFPTLYAARNTANGKRRDTRLAEYGILRRDILLQAKLTYIGMVRCLKMRRILEDRAAAADSLLSLLDSKSASGAATMLDINRARLDLMDLRIEISENETEYLRLSSALNSLRGVSGDAVSLQSAEYPDCAVIDSLEHMLPAMTADDPEIKAAAAALTTSRSEVAVSRQGWIPKISAGYRRNTELSEASNGFLIGLSLPLYSTSKEVRAAEARRRAAEISLDDTRARVANETAAARRDLLAARDALRLTDTALLDETLRLLRCNVMLGNMTVIDYCIEADRIYRKYAEYISQEAALHTSLATLLRNSL